MLSSKQREKRRIKCLNWKRKWINRQARIMILPTDLPRAFAILVERVLFRPLLLPLAVLCCLAVSAKAQEPPVTNAPPATNSVSDASSQPSPPQRGRRGGRGRGGNINTNYAAAPDADAAPAPDAAGQSQRLQQLQNQLQGALDTLKEMQTGGAGTNAAPSPANNRPPVTPTGPVQLDPKWIQALNWRSLGPAGMGGRITDFAVVESDPMTFWVATASGGLLKTTNNGVNFVHQFDHEATVSIGCVCVAPSDPNTVWVGTGENNPRNSVC